MGNFKIYTTFFQLLLLEIALKLNLEALYLTEPFPHSGPIINKHKEQVQKTTYGFIMSCIELYATGKTLSH